MSSEVQVSQDFQTRLYEKIKSDIGSLMTDEECKKLVASAIERIWFTPTQSGDSYYNRKIEPPKLLTVVTEAVGPMVLKAAKEWIAEHPEEVKDALDKALGGGMTAAILKAFDSMFAQTFSQLQFGLQETLRTALQGR